MVKDDKTVATPNTASIVIQFDNTVFHAGITLTLKNYDMWSQLMEMHIITREKMGYIRGKEKALAGINPKYDKLYAENQKVKS